MEIKYDPPSIDDIGLSFTSDEIYDSEVGKKFIEAIEEQRIEKCFEDIKQVLKKYGCKLYTDEYFIKIESNDYFEFYDTSDFDK